MGGAGGSRCLPEGEPHSQLGRPPPSSSACIFPSPSLSLPLFLRARFGNGRRGGRCQADSNGLWGSAPRPQVCEGVVVDPPARGGVPLHEHRCNQQTCPPTRTGESTRSIFRPLSVGGSPSPGRPCPGRVGSSLRQWWVRPGGWAESSVLGRGTSNGSLRDDKIRSPFT